jgi:hypothetical protein
VEAVLPLLDLLNEIDENHDDWTTEELPVVFGMIGERALPFLEKFIADDSNGKFPRIVAIHGVEVVGNSDEGSRDRSTEILNNQLELYEQNDPELNGYLISHLIEMKSTVSMPLIKEAYQGNCVDYSIIGDYEDVEISMGLRRFRKTSPDYLSETDNIVRAPGKKKKIGRNDPCPCGSGKKYKKCCMS